MASQTQKMTKNQLRRAKKKADREKVKAEQETAPLDASDGQADEESDAPESNEQTATEPPASDLAVKEPDDSSEAVSLTIDGPSGLDSMFEDPAFTQFREIFDKFGVSNGSSDDATGDSGGTNKGTVFYNDDDDDIPSENEEMTGRTRLSKKKRKQLSKLSVAELKALATVPEVVEWNDVSSSDPRMLVQIKAQRNVVPVPSHWRLKREYLSSKRGIEKAPFQLPKFIAETGITEMRDAVLEKQAEQTLKQKQRERVQPKMGRLDIDYQKLYDAFFRFQTKPDLTRFGEVYYEGKETEGDFKRFRPGELSDATKEALGMPPGAPPPWLINQQRFGPPPSYPNLKIPGLNAPLPPGTSWGFQLSGWGKPPVDEFNRPLYGGDVFGLGNAVGAAAPLPADAVQYSAGEPIERALWGELQPRDEESEEEESDEDEEEDGEDGEDYEGADDGDRTASGIGLQALSGLETPGGFVSSVPTDYGPGVETSMAGEMDLRKNTHTRRGVETEENPNAHPRSAYTVLQEKQVRAEGFFGSDRAYDMSAAERERAGSSGGGGGGGRGMPVLGQDDDTRKRKKPGDIEVALDPDELLRNDGINRDELRKRFDEGKREQGPGAQWARNSGFDDDLSAMIAQESRKRQKVEEKKSKFKF